MVQAIVFLPLLGAILAGLIALHLAAALYHHLVRKDGLFGRMWFGRRAMAASPERAAATTKKRAA